MKVTTPSLGAYLHIEKWAISLLTALPTKGSDRGTWKARTRQGNHRYSNNIFSDPLEVLYLSFVSFFILRRYVLFSKWFAFFTIQYRVSLENSIQTVHIRLWQTCPRNQETKRIRFTRSSSYVCGSPSWYYEEKRFENLFIFCELGCGIFSKFSDRGILSPVGGKWGRRRRGIGGFWLYHNTPPPHKALYYFNYPLWEVNFLWSLLYILLANTNPLSVPPENHVTLFKILPPPNDT